MSLEYDFRLTFNIDISAEFTVQLHITRYPPAHTHMWQQPTPNTPRTRNRPGFSMLRQTSPADCMDTVLKLPARETAKQNPEEPGNTSRHRPGNTKSISTDSTEEFKNIEKKKSDSIDGA